jgi:hypothetical protein
MQVISRTRARDGFVSIVLSAPGRGQAHLRVRERAGSLEVASAEAVGGHDSSMDALLVSEALAELRANRGMMGA